MREEGQGRASGRVNLIGEHLDYNGGTVLPAALTVGLSARLAPHDEETLVIRADVFGEPAVRALDEAPTGHWSDLALGAYREARALGLARSGARLTVESTIPPGAGLSSSAALVVAVLKAARDLAAASLGDVEIARAAQRVEHEFLGVPCGIMDQMAVALAQPGEAMALDCNTLDYRLLALPAAHEFAVIHSGVSRRLDEGRYGERRAECARASAMLGGAALCTLDDDTIARAALPEALRRRALHCAREQRRVEAAITALERGDMAQFGALMRESHASMRDLFEISLEPIDALVERALDLGALGARLTGGGFGGCIVALVERAQRDAVLAPLLKEFPEARLVDSARAA